MKRRRLQTQGSGMRPGQIAQNRFSEEPKDGYPENMLKERHQRLKEQPKNRFNEEYEATQSRKRLDQEEG